MSILSLLVVQLLSHVQLFASPWTAACQASLSFTVSQSPLKLVSFESVTLPNHLIFCCPVLFLSLIFPSIRVFFGESALHIRWPKYWSFSFSTGPSNEYSGLVSFRTDFLFCPWDSHESSPAPHLKVSILRCSAFFMVELSHPYMTTGKTHNFDMWDLSTRWCLWFLVSCLGLSLLCFQGARKFNFMAAITVHSDFVAQENKACHSFHFFPIYLPWSEGTQCYDLGFLNIEFEGLTDLISLPSKGLSRVFSIVQRHQFSGTQPSIHDYWKDPYLMSCFPQPMNIMYYIQENINMPILF